MDNLTVKVGDIVLYVLDEGRSRSETRPAFVVRVWADGLANLQVFTDNGQNTEYNDNLPCPLWKTSIKYDPNKHPGTWHWPGE